MKEIDLLPEWYKKGRKRQNSYHAQYVILCLICLTLLVIKFTTGISVSKAQARLDAGKTKLEQSRIMSRQFEQTKSQLQNLKNKADLLKKIDPKIDIAAVIAEISFLIEKEIVLSKVEFKAEQLTDNANSNTQRRRSGRRQSSKKEAISLGDIRFKIKVSGVAADSRDVADFACSLEDSPYFCQVIPLFSRNKEVKPGTNISRDRDQISEFEINCYLANYEEK
ncbi:hypothetical protein ACFL3G_01395 [Planctomycetota bacterium]